MIRGVLIDLSGVLYVGQQALPGAIDALARLRNAQLPYRFITNTSRRTRHDLYRLLSGLGFELREDEIITAVDCMLDYLRRHQLRPLLLIHPALAAEYAGLDSDAPNAVVLGDAADNFTYRRLNQAFRLLMEGAELLVMGDNRYFMDVDGLSLDIGPFKTALEYASGVTAKVLGKPAPEFFLQAAHPLNCPPEQVVMIGDDVQADILGACRAGLQGILVQTGKYRPGDEAVLTDQPAASLQADFAAAVDSLLQAPPTAE